MLDLFEPQAPVAIVSSGFEALAGMPCRPDAQWVDRGDPGTYKANKQPEISSPRPRLHIKALAAGKCLKAERYSKMLEKNYANGRCLLFLQGGQDQQPGGGSCVMMVVANR